MTFCCEKELRYPSRKARLPVGSKNDLMDRLFAQRGAFSPIPDILLCVVVPGPGSPPVLAPLPASDAFGCLRCSCHNPPPRPPNEVPLHHYLHIAQHFASSDARYFAIKFKSCINFTNLKHWGNVLWGTAEATCILPALSCSCSTS